jgi:ATP-dependent Clp protease ATP-binding subunit ClpX
MTEEDRTKTMDELLKHVNHDDLLQHGLIPEFVGRIPVVVSLQSLDEEALVRILTEPKNALVRQFQEFFSLDGVEMVFTEDALKATAEEALRHKTGARGLRTVLEDCLLDVMYEIPSRGDVKKCVVDGDTVRGIRRPVLLTSSGQALEIWGSEPKGETA